MANLSQQKRQRMLEFLQKLREEHKDDDSVLIALGEIESELNAKSTGSCGNSTRKPSMFRCVPRSPCSRRMQIARLLPSPEGHTISCWRAIICTASVFWKNA